METLKLFHLGLKTSVLVCDGASTNLCPIKATMGTLYLGAFGTMGPNKPHEVQSCFDKPFSPGHKIFWMLYGSYQVHVGCIFRSADVGED